MTLASGHISAFVAGFLSFFSPCVLPLAPGWLCYMAGVSFQDFRLSGQSLSHSRYRSALLWAALSFVFGFSTVFVGLGASSSLIGQFLRFWREPLLLVAGLLIILMGLNFLGLLRFPLFLREFRFNPTIRPATFLGGYAMGLAFAFGWTPCIGPVLGSILALAASRDSVAEGSLLLLLYSMGFGIPFILTAFFSSFFVRFLERLRSYFGVVEKIIGCFLIAFGVLLLMDKLDIFSYMIFKNFGSPLF